MDSKVRDELLLPIMKLLASLLKLHCFPRPVIHCLLQKYQVMTV